jgi:uncharacterized membrane protein
MGEVHDATRRLRDVSAVALRVIFSGLMCVGVWLMLESSASYLELGELHPFFLEKLPLAHPKWWTVSLYAHVPSALFCLPACLVLLVQRVRVKVPRLHRWLGRVTAVLLLLVMVPSGMYLALFAQGGWVTTLGFWLTGLMTWVAMVLSVQRARAGDMKSHRRFSTHVVAQLSVAVLSRFFLVAMEEAELYSEAAYVAALWVPVIGCAVVAEVLTGPRRGSSRTKGVRHEALAAVSTLDPVR